MIDNFLGINTEGGGGEGGRGGGGGGGVGGHWTLWFAI